MEQILVRLHEDVAREVRRVVREKYRGRRGALSALVEDALVQAIRPPAEVSAAALLEVIDYVSRASKEGRSKDEILTNVFLMLDREFEQSIIRGIEDMKKDRYQEVPKGEEPVEFLRRLAVKT